MNTFSLKLLRPREDAFHYISEAFLPHEAKRIEPGEVALAVASEIPGAGKLIEVAANTVKSTGALVHGSPRRNGIFIVHNLWGQSFRLELLDQTGCYRLNVTLKRSNDNGTALEASDAGYRWSLKPIVSVLFFIPWLILALAMIEPLLLLAVPLVFLWALWNIIRGRSARQYERIHNFTNLCNALYTVLALYVDSRVEEQNH